MNKYGIFVFFELKCLYWMGWLVIESLFIMVLVLCGGGKWEFEVDLLRIMVRFGLGSGDWGEIYMNVI